MMNNHNQAINRLEIQTNQLANSLSERQKGSLQSQPLTNLKNSFPVHDAQDTQPNQCNIVHVLRSGKQVDNQVSVPPVTTKPKSNSIEASIYANFKPNTLENEEKKKEKSAEDVHEPIVPFLKRLKTSNIMHRWKIF